MATYYMYDSNFTAGYCRYPRSVTTTSFSASTDPGVSLSIPASPPALYPESNYGLYTASQYFADFPTPEYPTDYSTPEEYHIDYPAPEERPIDYYPAPEEYPYYYPAPEESPVYYPSPEENPTDYPAPEEYPFDDPAPEQFPAYYPAHEESPICYPAPEDYSIDYSAPEEYPVPVDYSAPDESHYPTPEESPVYYPAPEEYPSYYPITEDYNEFDPSGVYSYFYRPQTVAMASTSNRFAALEQLDGKDQIDNEDGDSGAGNAEPEKVSQQVKKDKNTSGRGGGKLASALKTHIEFTKYWTNIAKELESLQPEAIAERIGWLHLDKLNISLQGKKRFLQNYYKQSVKKLLQHEKTKMNRPFKNNTGKGQRNKYHFDYFVVIDFEATCEQHTPPDYKHEIIQFPAVLIDPHRQEIVAEFNNYCKPRVNSTLTGFCKGLTGITQETVDSAPDFVDVFDDFNKWLESHELGTRYTFVIVADGFCDMGKFLYTQCMMSGVNYPAYAHQWIDIRLLFFHFYGVKWYKLPISLELLGERFCGTLHNGLDDSRNIGRVLLKILKGGASPIPNERIILDRAEQEKNPPTHKYELRTVKYMYPREFFAMQAAKGYSGNKIRNWHSQQARESVYNKENWFQATNGLHQVPTHVSGSPPSYPAMYPSPPPVPRVNKLNQALRNLYSQENSDEDSSEVKKMERIELVRKKSKSESSV